MVAELVITGEEVRVIEELEVVMSIEELEGVMSIDELLESLDVIVDTSVDVETGSVEVVKLGGEGVMYTTVVVYVTIAVYVVVYGDMVEVLMSVVVVLVVSVRVAVST